MNNLELPEGFIPWDGTKAEPLSKGPFVEDYVYVEIYFRSGLTDKGLSKLYWWNWEKESSSFEIIGYRKCDG